MEKLHRTLFKDYLLVLGSLIILTALIVCFNYREDNSYNALYIISIIAYLGVSVFTIHNLHNTYGRIAFREYLKGYQEASKYATERLKEIK